MMMHLRFALTTCLILLCGIAGATRAVETADTVYTNGKIYTVNAAQPWAEAVAIKDGEFVAVGTNAEVKALTGKDTEVVDLKGGFAMPGLVGLPSSKCQLMANLLVSVCSPCWANISPMKQGPRSFVAQLAQPIV